MPRYGFVSPGAMAAQSIEEFLLQREALKRQAEQDAMARTREERLLKSTDANIENTRANTAALNAQRAANVALGQEEGKAKRDARSATLFRPGDVLPPGADVSPELKDAQTTIPGRSLTLPTTPGITDISGQAQRGGPSAPPAPQTPGIMVPGQALAATPTGRDVYRGTVKQRGEADADARFNAFVNNPDIPDSVRRYVGAQRAAGDTSLPYQLFEGAQTKAIVRVSPDKSKLQLFKGGQWVPIGAEGVPKDAQLLMEPQPGEGDSKPYFIPVQSAQGILSYDARTGQVVGRVGDLKPSEGAGKDIAAAMNVSQQIDTIKTEFNPAKVGPLMGRLKNLDQQFWGSDPEYARFQAELRTLGNTIIQLRTGAAMTVDEAKRILAEISNENLPPSTFVARLGRLEELYDQYLSNRAKVAYGRTTKSDVDRMTGGAPAPGAAPPTTETPEQRRARLKGFLP